MELGQVNDRWKREINNEIGTTMDVLDKMLLKIMGFHSGKSTKRLIAQQALNKMVRVLKAQNKKRISSNFIT